MSEKTIDIGKIYFVKDNQNTKMCSDIRIGDRQNTLWFSLKNEHAKYFCERADAFVMAILPTAMRKGYDIVCDNVISKKLHYQITHYIIPILADVTEIYSKIDIHADLAEEFKSENAVGAAFSGGVDSLYTFLTHGNDSEYPITHLCVFNTGSFINEEGKIDESKLFLESCEKVEKFAKEHNLNTAFVDTNIEKCFYERFITVTTFRNLACVLAIQKLLGTYLISSSGKATEFLIDQNINETYDLFLVPLASTESLTFYLSGMEKTRVQKIEFLTEHELSYKLLHPCVKGSLYQKNCGHCTKCRRDLATLWYLGKLDDYREVFDVDEYNKNLNKNLAYAMANTRSRLNREVSRLLLNSDKLPKGAMEYNKYFSLAMNNLKDAKEKGTIEMKNKYYSY